MSDQIYDDPEKILKADDASRVVLERYWRSRDHLVSKMRDKWDEWYKSYRAYVKQAQDNVRSNLILPLIFSHIEAYLPRLIANRPRIEAWGRGPEDKVRAAQHRALLFYDWDIMKMAFKLVNFVKSAEIFGTAWTKVWHKKEVRTRIVMEQQITPRFDPIFGVIPTGQNLEMIEVEKPVTTWDDPDCDLLEVDEVFPDPDGKDEDSAAYLIHRREGITLDHLEMAERKNGDKLYNPEVVAKLRKMSEGGNQWSRDLDETLQRSRREIFGPEMQPQADEFMRQFTLLEQWTDDKVVAIVEEFPELPPLRNERNPYGIKPFIRYTPIPDPNALYGISIPEILYSLQLEMSTLHNVRMDHALQAAHLMTTIIRGSGVNANNVRYRPGGSIYVNSHDDIQYLHPPPMEFSLYRESDDLRLHAQQASGATDTFSGVRSAVTGRTATEAALLSQASGSRAGLMFQLLGIQALNRLGKILTRINEAHIDDERLVRVIGSEFQGQPFAKITPEELTSGTGVDLDVVIDVADTEPGNKLFKRKEAAEALQILGGVYQDPNHPVVQRFVQILGETFDIDNMEQLSQVQAQPPQPQGSQAAPSGVENLGDQLAADQGGDGSDGRLLLQG